MSCSGRATGQPASTCCPEGAIVGEIGLFAPTHARTTGAICETDVVALVLTEDKVLQLYYQDPRFGFS